VRTAIALFTRDLRLRDNAMLAGAHASSDRVLPLFVVDDDLLLRTAHGRPNRFGFLAESLRDLDASLRARGGALFVRRGNWVEEVVRIAEECGAASVHLARDVSGYAQRRTAHLRKCTGTDVVLHDHLTVVPPDALGRAFVVFTAYYKRWLDQPWRPLAPIPRRITTPAGVAGGELPTGTSPGGWQGGETAALARLKAWTGRGLRAYAETRDDPAGDATSRASPALHFGCLSASEMAQRLWDRAGAEPYLRQLCWRDFYAQLLWYRPEAARRDLRSGAPRWREAPGDLEAWKAGRTGFPFVDAGMRQLRAEGWMHNRVRMVVASFLTKDLLIDWRAGAQHFMDLLVDGDVAQNQLNWQWVAGTGTDANPFRVLNPTVQGRRHDPRGTYLRRWIAELGKLPADVDVHDPPFDIRRAVGYPEPILDHAEAIEVWRAARG
jgi:deoxyribodipyrimidine photo-lyase